MPQKYILNSKKSTIYKASFYSNKKPTEVGNHIPIILSIFFLKPIAENTPAVAPIVFAKTSVTSGVLVVVKTPCRTSIVIPKKTENINEIRYAL